MSPRAPKKCGRDGCEVRVPGGTRYCAEHEAEAQRRASANVRGYGADHRNARRRALAAFVPGQPCVRCGQPMTDASALDLDHTDDRNGYLGLAHRRCNSRAGAMRAVHG